MLLNPIQARALLEYALKERFAMLAVNADSPAAIYDCLLAAKQAEGPIIIESSLWQLEGISFGGGDAVLGLGRYIVDTALLANSDEFKDVPALYHTDHIKGPKAKNILENAVKGVSVRLENADIRLSPSTISLDASELSNDENISFINGLIEVSKKSGRPITVEMEAGVDSGLTPPEEIKALVEGVEKNNPKYLYIFAPGLGSRHGYSKEGFPAFQPEMVARDIDLIEECIGRRIGIALHGSSGLSEEQLKQAVNNGVIKINWATDSLALRSKFAMEYYNNNAEKLVLGHKEFKITAMDNGVNQYISKNYVPCVQKRIEIQGGGNKNEGFWKYSGILNN